MEKIINLLAPRNRLGLVLRVVLFTIAIGLANMVFAVTIVPRLPDVPLVYDLTRALVVGVPFLWLFFAVMLHQVRLQRRLSFLSCRDWLTGLNNRRTFFDLATLRTQQCKTGILLMLDADHFKQINDTYGHQAGDSCLKAIAYMLNRNLRTGDISGRIGGEEFAILLADTTPDHARVISERLAKPIPFRAGPAHLTVTLSIGAVVATPDTPLDVLFSLADRALYQAKSEGRARVVFAEPVFDTTQIRLAV